MQRQLAMLVGAWLMVGGLLSQTVQADPPSPPSAPPPQQTSQSEASDAAPPEAQTETQTETPAITHPLDELAWLVGTWEDNDGTTQIITECDWALNQQFLKRSFRVFVDSELTLHGEQWIAWDPQLQQIRSWTFDSEGGRGEGLWIRDDNQWLVKTAYTLADGTSASSLNVHTFVDNDRMLWRSINREIGGELQPDIPEVEVTRKTARQETVEVQPIQQSTENQPAPEPGNSEEESR